MKCDLAWGAAYAEDLECREFSSEDEITFSFDLRSVSTNFDPKYYGKYGDYQLYKQELLDDYEGTDKGTRYW